MRGWGLGLEVRLLRLCKGGVQEVEGLGLRA